MTVIPDDDPRVDDDLSHPIPRCFDLDIVAAKRGGGADLVIVVAEPLEGDERSQVRLLKKLQVQLGFICSDEYREEFGEPSPERTTVMVALSQGCAPEIAELLEQCDPWIRSNSAALRVNAG